MADRVIRPIPSPPRHRVTRETIERLRELGASEHVILYAEWALRREEDEVVVMADWITEGSLERRWWARLHFRVLGRWPRCVVEERLLLYELCVDRLHLETLRRYLDG